MMELSHSLTLNEEALSQIAEAKRPVFVFEWLRFLDKVLGAAQKSDIKECQKKLVEQLLNQVQESPGPPTRRLIGRCLATLFSVGDTFLLFEAVNRCTDILKNKDDSPSVLPTRLGAITCIGAMYEKLGRMMGRSHEEAVTVMLKSLKNAESQTRCETMITMEKIIAGMGTAAGSVHKDIFKAARHCMTDRVMPVRCAAAQCLQEMLKHVPFVYTSELETVASLCFRSFEGSNYEVRCAVANLLGTLVATTQQASQPAVGKNRLATFEEVLALMSSGFLRGGIGFLKGGAGEMIKGSSNVSREIRVGVTHAYVVLVRQLGGLWLERNLNTLLVHLLELVSSPRAATSHVDAVYSRKCIVFILRSVLGKMLGEKAQVAACKDLVQIIVKYSNADAAAESSGSKEGLQEAALAQHVLVCALQELGCLISSLGTTASSVVNDSSSGIIEAVVSVLIHSSAARLTAAWCLRSIAAAVPSQLTPLLDRCLEQLDTLKASPEAICGYSGALSALLGAACDTALGIPHSKGKIIFNVAEDLLRTASQNSRLSVQRTQAGWLMIGAVMTLGPPVVRGLLPRMLLLWKNSFPRSTKELESEKARGDAFTWQVTLEGRAGALAAMASFLIHCKELVSEEVVRRLLLPVEAALAMLTSLTNLIKSYGQHLKAAAAMVRLRLYEVLILLPAQSYEGSYTSLLRLLVAEFTLTENPANTTTSLLRSLCHTDDSVILGSWLQETDHKAIEDQMEPNRRLDRDNLQPNSASGSGALEHDLTALYKSLPKGESVPGPLPLGVAVIDMSVVLFGQTFPYVAVKHRLQMLEHFSQCIRHTKASRQEAVQINIFTAVLSALKMLAETKTPLGPDDVRQAAASLVLGALSHPNPILRCAAGEALGRMAQVVGDGRFVAEMAQHSFDKLKTARDAVSRTGHSLTLGCLHRYVGGMGSGQHLNTSVSILLALANDTNAPVVQVWALHAIALIADSGGPMFRGYVEPTLSLALKLLLNIPPSHVDVLQCIGKSLSALITTVGPELQGNTNSISTARSSFLVACAIMQDHGDSLVHAEAISCLQQLHMFAPRHVNLSTLVPTLCCVLYSSHLLLRRAAVACLRQLSQREAKEVCEHALSWARESGGTSSGYNSNISIPAIGETGLPGVLFAMLDVENDLRLVGHIKDTLTSMLQALAKENLAQWLSLCKDVLTAADSSSSSMSSQKESEKELGDDEADVDDEERFKSSEEPVSHPFVSPRWPTRVFSAISLRRIIEACDGNRAHFDLAMAREQKLIKPKEDFLVLHLSDLIRMAFMAATSESDPLRLEGLRTLQLIIDKFSKVPEPEFPGHVILEQYQAQVGAALRPAFSPETPSHVTAMACQVCSAWIGSGVARDLNDLRRVHQLLVSSLNKLHKGTSSHLYNESASTLEKLAILKAWSEVFVVAMEQEKQISNVPSSQEDRHDDEDGSCGQESLLKLVTPELVSLSKHWLAALKDHALLSLPAEFSSQLPHDGGAFYTPDTMDSARQYYRKAWPPILHAAALWLCTGGFESLEQEFEQDANTSGTMSGPPGNPLNKVISNPNSERFHLLFGICMEALCSPRSSESLECVLVCLQPMELLLKHPLPKSLLGQDTQLCIELCNVLHRILLTREAPRCQLIVMEIAHLVLEARHDDIRSHKKRKLKELAPANQELEDVDTALAALGEGGETGDIVPGQSVVFALLEVCLCLLVRQLPHISPALANSTGTFGIQAATRSKKLTEESSKLIAATLSVMSELPNLCSPKGSTTVLPTILYLTTGVLKETAVQTTEDRGLVVALPTVSTTLQSLKSLCTSPFTRNKLCASEWLSLLQSALARILDLSKTSCEDSKPDEISMLLAVAVFILSAPGEVVSTPNLQFPCINLFKQALQLDGDLVQLKCVQTLRSMFQHPDRSIATPYIHALAPRVVEILVQLTADLTTQSTVTDRQFSLATECLNCLDTLVTLASSDKKIHVLSLYIPLVVNLLIEPTLQQGASHNRKKLHDHALQQLIKVGPQYPQDFRSIMTQAPQLRGRLENAIRKGSLIHVGSREPSTIPSSQKVNSSQAPAIKLKMDFSNFTG
ncbi:HEAT repeat-containing protein 5B isoform X4 [Tachypleus tridentatus]